MTSPEHRTADTSFSARSIDTAARTFAGYASVFGNVDSFGDTIVKGAFARTLRERPHVLLLWHHAPTQPLGVWTELREDDTGLFVRGRLSQTPLGDEALTLLKDGALDGLSIGFKVVSSSRDEYTGRRTLTDVELLEVSIVSWPANDAARISEVRTASLGGPQAHEFHLMDVLVANMQIGADHVNYTTNALARIADQREAAAKAVAATREVQHLEYDALMARYLNSSI